MPLPSELLEAISDPGGGKVALVLGAGCSMEEPTSLPSSAQCSITVHQRLVNNEVLSPGDSNDPYDLSAVADAVLQKTGFQGAVIDAIQAEYNLRFAKANEGYLAAAAMLYEGAISAVITLNFDLAISDAITDLRIGHAVGVIERPSHIPHQKVVNVYYLHRNANEEDLESWVLRKGPLQTAWEGNWKQVITTKVLISPVVIFAGLGTPVAVLIESAKLIKAAVPNGTHLFQVDTGPKENSKYFAELGLTAKSFIQMGWIAFMEELSRRLLLEHVNRLNAAVAEKTQPGGVEPENLEPLIERIRALGLVRFGRLRAHWLLDRHDYYRAENDAMALVADLLLGLAIIGRVSGAITRIFENGLVEFHRGSLTIAYIVASGRGHNTRSTLEPTLAIRSGQYRAREPVPVGAIISGALPSATPTPPEDVVRGDRFDDLVSGPEKLRIFDIAELRADHDLIAQVVQ